MLRNAKLSIHNSNLYNTLIINMGFHVIFKNKIIEIIVPTFDTLIQITIEV